MAEKNYPLEKWNNEPSMYKVVFGVPSIEAGNKRTLPLKVVNFAGENVDVETRLRVVCTAGAIMDKSPSSQGSVKAGAGTADIILATGDDGTFYIDVTFAGVGNIEVMSCVTVGSLILDCSDIATLAFA